jgi:hypothetical protein
MEDENKKPEFKMPEMTPEQKAKLDSVGLTVGKLNKMMTPFLFNQLQMIEDGEIHIHLTVKKWDIARIELNSHLARNLVREPEGDEES